MRHFAHALVIGFCLGIVGCTTAQEPAVEIRTVEVPVPVSCLTAEQLGKDPFVEPPLVGHLLGRTPETAEQDRDILGASALGLRAWGKEMYAALSGCAE